MSHPIIIWLLIVELLGLIAIPLAFVALPGLIDRGWVIAKTIGLIAAAWLIWVLVSLGVIRYTFTSIWIVIGGLTVVGALLWWSQWHALRRHLREKASEVLLAEAIFLGGFAIFVLLRMWYPDLGHQFSPVSPTNIGAGRMGEKQLELGFLNAITRSQTFPPIDPFFSGGYINYYYFGYVVVATLCKAATIAPATGFNLAIATFFGLVAGTAFSIGRSVGRSKLTGFVSVLFLCVIGNLNGLVQAVQDLQSVSAYRLAVPFLGGALELGSGIFQATVRQSPTPSFDFWESTRLVPPVGVDFAEFPFFTFLFGDLHAHLMALPIDLAVVGLSLSVALRRSSSRTGQLVKRTKTLWRRWPGNLLASATLGAFLLGAIEATNPLDYPTYLAVLALGFSAALLLHHFAGPPTSARRLVAAVSGVVVLTGISAIGAILLFPPLNQGYHPVFDSGLATVQSQLSAVRASLVSAQPGLAGTALTHAVHDAVVYAATHLLGDLWPVSIRARNLGRSDPAAIASPAKAPRLKLR